MQKLTNMFKGLSFGKLIAWTNQCPVNTPMQELGVVSYLLQAQFVTPGQCSIANRQAFAEILAGVDCDDPMGKALLSMYAKVNFKCDDDKVDLANEELAFFKNIFTPGNSFAVYDLFNKENAMFMKTAKNYPTNSLNYTLRAYRPAFLENLLMGDLTLKAKENSNGK